MCTCAKAYNKLLKCANTGTESNHSTAKDDNFLKDGIEQLDRKVDEISNQTQGNSVYM